MVCNCNQGDTSSDYLQDILQYNTASHTWEEFGQMKVGRSDHALAVLDDVSKLCLKYCGSLL